MKILSATVPTIPTGVPGLDELISGGFPKGRVILIIGGPGSVNYWHDTLLTKLFTIFSSVLKQT